MSASANASRSGGKCLLGIAITRVPAAAAERMPLVESSTAFLASPWRQLATPLMSSPRRRESAETTADDHDPEPFACLAADHVRRPQRCVAPGCPELSSSRRTARLLDHYAPLEVHPTLAAAFARD